MTAVPTQPPRPATESALIAEDAGYQKLLKPRQLQMIAIGGAIGTGLFLGAGGRLAEAGPGLFVVYGVCGVFVFLILRAMGELVLHRPSSGSFVSYAREFLGEKAAYVAGWMYFLNWAMTTIVDSTAIAIYFHFWSAFEGIPQWLIALVALALVLGMNLVSVLLASPAYLAARGVPAHPAELAAHDCLLYLGGASAASGSWTFARNAAPVKARGRKARAGTVERVGVNVRGSLKANNSEVLREALLAGLGIGLLPDFSVPPPGADGQPALVQVLPDWQAQGFFGDRLYALRPWSAQVPKAVQCLVEFLRAHFAPGFTPGFAKG